MGRFHARPRLCASLLAALLIAPLAPFVGSAHAEDTPYVAAIREGMRLYDEAKYEAALGHFLRARQIYPADWRGHTWQALTLLQMAITEQDPLRRQGLLEEAEAMTGAPLLKQAGLRFQDPLRHYLMGLLASLGGRPDQAYMAFTKARTSSPALFEPYAEILLRERVEVAFARTCMDLGKSLILAGKWPEADGLMQQALRIFSELGREDDPAMRELHRHCAVVDESLGRFDRAIAHLHACIKLNAGNPVLQEEFRATIAMIYLSNEQLEEGLKALEALPEDCMHPEYIAARARANHKIAEDGLDPAKVEHALAYYRKMMPLYPAQDVYRLVVDYVRLLRDKIAPADVPKQREVLEEAIAMLERERSLRPECPDLYWWLHRIHSLLGNDEEALSYQRIYERKKEEYKNQARFDPRGRPRCSTA